MTVQPDNYLSASTTLCYSLVTQPIQDIPIPTDLHNWVCQIWLNVVITSKDRNGIASVVKTCLARTTYLLNTPMLPFPFR